MSALSTDGWFLRNIIGFFRRCAHRLLNRNERRDACGANSTHSADDLRPFASSPCSMHELDPAFQRFDSEPLNEKIDLELD